MARSGTNIARRAFTLTELIVVMGLIVVLASLLLPAVGKVRAAANTTVCLSNLRQIGTAWEMYTAEHRGRLLDYVWRTPQTPEVAWYGYWPGIAEHYDVRGDLLFCPAARELPFSTKLRGYGNVNTAWSGKFSSNGTAIRLNANTYRVSSYGMNRYMTARVDLMMRVRPKFHPSEISPQFQSLWIVRM